MVVPGIPEASRYHPSHQNRTYSHVRKYRQAHKIGTRPIIKSSQNQTTTFHRHVCLLYPYNEVEESSCSGASCTNFVFGFEGWSVANHSGPNPPLREAT